MEIDKKDKLKNLYKKMYKLTQEKCSSCNPTCCNDNQCDFTKQIAKETWGVDSGKAPYMTDSGCSIDPHLRQLCTLHICEKHYMLDPVFNKRYFKLRDKITILEFEVYKCC